MKRGWLINLCLLILLVAGAYFVEWQEKKGEAAKEAETASKTLSLIKKEEFTRIAMVDSNSQAFVVEKGQEQKWSLTQPQSLRTDPHAVARILEQLTKTYTRKVSDKVENFAAYGLDKPEAVVTLYAGKEKQVRFTVGGKAPASGERYLLIDEQPLVLIPEHAIWAFLQKYDKMRESEIAAQRKLATMTAIELTRAENKLNFVKKEGNIWYMESPWQDRVSEQRLENWLSSLTGTMADHYVAKPTKESQWQLKIVGQGGEEKLAIWKDDKGYIVDRPGEPDASWVNGQLVSELEKSPFDLVEHKPVLDKIADLSLERANKSYSAHSTDGSWPKPAWQTLANTLQEDVWKVEKMEDLLKTQASYMVVKIQGEKTQSCTFYQREEQLVLQCDHRSVLMQLSKLQSEELQKAVADLTGEEKPAVKTPALVPSPPPASDKPSP